MWIPINCHHSSSEKCMNPGREIKDRLLVHYHHVLPAQPLFWSKLESLGLCWPELELCVVLDYTDLNKRSWLVHQKGTWRLEGQSKPYFQSNLAIFYPANPCFGAKLSVFVAVSTKNTAVFGCRTYDRTHAPLWWNNDEFYWYSYNVHSCIVALLVGIAIK